MIYYTYVLKSVKDHKLYIGHTRNLKKRLKEHSSRLVLATKNRLPLKLIYYEAYIEKQDAIGRIIHAGRQSVKDLFDLYYLSKDYRPLSEFFFEYFSYDKAESLIAWYRGFNRMRLKIELLELIPNVDTAKIIEHLDNELLKKLPEKII